MNTKHTPGPWGVQPAKGTLCAWTVTDRFKTVAFIAQTIGNNQEENANARLIAAAPELLEACKVLADLCTDAKCVQSVKWTSARDQAQAAIQKAEGTV